MTFSKPSSTSGTAWGYPCNRHSHTFPLRWLINAYENCLTASLSTVGLTQGREWFRTFHKLLYCFLFLCCEGASEKLLCLLLAYLSWSSLVQTTQRRKWGLTAQCRDTGRALVHRYTTDFTFDQTWISILCHSCSFNSAESALPVKILVIYCKRGFLPLMHRLANMFYFHCKEISTIDRILKTSVLQLEKY